MKRVIPLLALALLAGCGRSSQTYEVRYRITGTAERTHVTLATPHGTEQRQVNIPYTSPIETFRPSEFAYVSAQNDNNNGPITVEILHRDQVVRTATSQGPFAVAVTKWSVGSSQ